MPTPTQKRGRNYIVIGMCFILGAALLFWRYSTVTIPGTPGLDEEATIVRVGWLTGLLALGGVVTIYRGIRDLRKDG